MFQHGRSLAHHVMIPAGENGFEPGIVGFLGRDAFYQCDQASKKVQDDAQVTANHD